MTPCPKPAAREAVIWETGLCGGSPHGNKRHATSGSQLRLVIIIVNKALMRGVKTRHDTLE